MECVKKNQKTIKQIKKQVTEYLIYQKHSYENKNWYLLTARSTFIPVKVKFPSFGIQTPFPFLSCLAMYWPRASQMVSDALKSRS